MNTSEESAVTELWNEFESNLRRICKVKMTGCENDIDDIINETYAALCKKNQYGWNAI